MVKTLAFDLDGKSGLDTFLSRRWIMKYLGLKLGKPNLLLYKEYPKRYSGLPETSTRVWHTTNGWHLEIDLDNELDNIKAVLMQSLLGSDYRRELALLLRIERGCKNWNNLYQQKWKVNELSQRIQVSFENFDADLSQKVQNLLELGE
jgi:hypothetical protein